MFARRAIRKRNDEANAGAFDLLDDGGAARRLCERSQKFLLKPTCRRDANYQRRYFSALSAPPRLLDMQRNLAV
jgi:hypothetical protein